MRYKQRKNNWNTYKNIVITILLLSIFTGVAMAITPTITVSPISGPQNTIFQFAGNDFTPTGDVDLHILMPNNTEYIFQSLLADNTGKISNQYLDNCDSLVGTYTAWAIDRVTDIKSNNITFAITASSNCVATTPIPTPTQTHDVTVYYIGLGLYPDILETNDLLRAADDWRSNIIPQGFSSPITTVQLLTLADKWRNSS